MLQHSSLAAITVTAITLNFCKNVYPVLKFKHSTCKKNRISFLHFI